MKPLEHIKTIIFDWDGTLHNSFQIYKPAFLESMDYLEKLGYVKKMITLTRSLSLI